jgi:hypothetical protein
MVWGRSFHQRSAAQLNQSTSVAMASAPVLRVVLIASD